MFDCRNDVRRTLAAHYGGRFHSTVTDAQKISGIFLRYWPVGLFFNWRAPHAEGLRQRKFCGL
jgi:hypothetical protein